MSPSPIPRFKAPVGRANGPPWAQAQTDGAGTVARGEILDVDVSLLRRDFSRHGDLPPPAADVVVGCCLADLFSPDILVSAVLRAFSPALLLYLPVTFYGTTAPGPARARTQTRAERWIRREVVARKNIHAWERIATVAEEPEAPDPVLEVPRLAPQERSPEQ